MLHQPLKVPNMIKVDNENPLFASRRIAHEFEAPPVVVLGLPRSGTSFLSYVLSAIEDWYVFDDLYLRRQALGIGASGPITPEQLKKLLHYLTWRVRSKIKKEDDFFKPPCTLEDMDHFEKTFYGTFYDKKLTWPELLEEFLIRYALLHGKTRWGYKAPGEFLHLDELMKLFPGTRIIFCLRDPRNVMSSYKFLEGKDGTKNVYHPVAYAKYWALAQQTLEKAQQKGIAVELVLFEDAVNNPLSVGRRLAKFLGSELNEKELPQGANTSFRSGKRQKITPTETWICERLCNTEMTRLGYSLTDDSPRLRDVPDLLQTTFRFATHQTHRAISRPDFRNSIFSMAKRLARG